MISSMVGFRGISISSGVASSIMVGVSEGLVMSHFTKPAISEIFTIRDKTMIRSRSAFKKVSSTQRSIPSEWVSKFEPRSSFEFDPDLKWFPHHMAKTVVAIPKKIPIVDVVLEVRDARLPITSAQFEISDVMKLKPNTYRLVILNKVDLVPKLFSRRAVGLLELQGTPVLTTSAVNHSNISPLVDFITSNVKLKFKSLGVTVMVVGLPNTGKSTLLNAMKQACTNPSLDKASAKTSGMPGSTTQVGRIQISSHHPKIYVLDTPGVMFTKSGLEKISAPSEVMMKLAAVGSIPDTLTGYSTLCDYILFLLNQQKALDYVKIFRLNSPTNDSNEVVHAAAVSINGGTSRIDLNAGSAKFISMFRKGELGKICLDEIPSIEKISAEIEKQKMYLYETEPPGPWGPETYSSSTSPILRAIYKSSSS
jgi:mitochondrial GTPase 1